MRRLTVLYDARCALCLRCRDYLASYSTVMPLEFLASQSPEASARFGEVPWLGEELVVVSDEGEVWVGPAAFLVCMWALRDTREWSYRLSTPLFAPLAGRFFAVFSANRSRIAAFVQPRCDESSCGAAHDAGQHAGHGQYR